MPKPERQFLEDLERMSTASLEELLLLDFQKPGESDMSGLFCAAEVLSRRKAAPETSADQAWEIFVEKYLPFAGTGNSLYEDAETPCVSAPAAQPAPALPFRRKRPPPICSRPDGGLPSSGRAFEQLPSPIPFHRHLPDLWPPSSGGPDPNTRGG